MLLLVSLAILVIVLDIVICPKIDITDNNDILLWYNNLKGQRDYIFLFKR